MGGWGGGGGLSTIVPGRKMLCEAYNREKFKCFGVSPKTLSQ